MNSSTPDRKAALYENIMMLLKGEDTHPGGVGRKCVKTYGEAEGSVWAPAVTALLSCGWTSRTGAGHSCVDKTVDLGHLPSLGYRLHWPSGSRCLMAAISLLQPDLHHCGAEAGWRVLSSSLVGWETEACTKEEMMLACHLLCGKAAQLSWG